MICSHHHIPGKQDDPRVHALAPLTFVSVIALVTLLATGCTDTEPDGPSPSTTVDRPATPPTTDLFWSSAWTMHPARASAVTRPSLLVAQFPAKRSMDAVVQKSQPTAGIAPQSARPSLRNDSANPSRDWQGAGRLIQDDSSAETPGDAPAAEVPVTNIRPRLMNHDDESALIPTVWPVPNSTVTSPYGWRDHPIRRGRAFHSGLDLRASAGSVIHAFAAGTVNHSGPAGDYGNLIIIDHGNGWETRYAHADHLEVVVGQSVTAGQPIATAGESGLTTAPHLHFEIRHQGRSINPTPFLPHAETTIAVVTPQSGPDS